MFFSCSRIPCTLSLLQSGTLFKSPGPWTWIYLMFSQKLMEVQGLREESHRGDALFSAQHAVVRVHNTVGFIHRDANYHWRWALLGFPLPSFSPSLYLFIYWLSCTAWVISVPWPGTEPGPGQWKCRAMTTRSPGNSLNILPFKMSNYLRGDAWRLCKCPVCP